MPRLTSVTLRVTGDTADEVLVAQVTDTSGDLTGYFGGVFTMTATTAATTYYASFPALGGVAGGNTYTVDIDDASAMVAVTATAKVPTLTTTTISPSSIRAAKGSAVVHRNICRPIWCCYCWIFDFLVGFRCHHGCIYHKDF